MKFSSCHLLSAMLAIALSLFSTSCSKNEPLPDQLIGKLELKVNLQIKETDAESNLKSATTDDFTVAIYIAETTDPLLTFENESEIPESLELPIGEYYATASSGDNPAAAFENPYYFGRSENFIITAGETSQVEIIYSLANIMASVIYSERVKSSFSDYNTIVSNSSASLTFTKDETRNGYFNSDPLAIEAKLNYLSGGTSQTKTLTGEIANPQAGKHYEIRVDASFPEGSTSIIIIQLNDEVEKEIIELTDDSSSGEGETEGIGFGDLLITEIMFNPDSLDDSEGEWFEIYNNSDSIINLKDLVIRRGSNDTFHQISSDVNLNAGAYAVMGKTEIATDNVAYVYAGINLKNLEGDEIIINTYGTDGTDGTVICSVDYGAVGFDTGLAGKSIQLDPSIKDPTEARLGSNWCSSTEIYSTGNKGTPGVTNTSCN